MPTAGKCVKRAKTNSSRPKKKCWTQLNLFTDFSSVRSDEFQKNKKNFWTTSFFFYSIALMETAIVLRSWNVFFVKKKYDLNEWNVTSLNERSECGKLPTWLTHQVGMTQVRSISLFTFTVRHLAVISAPKSIFSPLTFRAGCLHPQCPAVTKQITMIIIIITSTFYHHR